MITRIARFQWAVQVADRSQSHTGTEFTARQLEEEMQKTYYRKLYDNLIGNASNNIPDPPVERSLQ